MDTPLIAALRVELDAAYRYIDRMRRVYHRVAQGAAPDPEGSPGCDLCRTRRCPRV